MQSSHTFTRCTKQNKLVTLLLGHLHRPISWGVEYSISYVHAHKTYLTLYMYKYGGVRRGRGLFEKWAFPYTVHII